MTEQYLIALDLDGTLLTDEKVISPYTKKIIQQVRELGHIVMISTGRPYRSSATFYQEMNLDTPIVNFNGAFVHHPTDPTWGTFHEPMSLDVVKDIVKSLTPYQVFNIIAEVRDDVYIHNHNEKLLDIFSFGNPTITEGNLLEYLNEQPTSLLIHADQREVAKIRNYLSDVHAEVIDHRRWGAPWHIIEIVKAGLSKAVGIERVSQYYNIPKERIIAFGDEDNDLEMIEYAGVGVAMGNAINPLKNIANHVTKSNMHDGIGKFLAKFFGITN